MCGGSGIREWRGTWGWSWAAARGCVARLAAVAELAAEQLAGDRLGQLVEELDLAGVLVGGHLLAAEGDELLGRDGLAAVGVGHADHGGLAYRLVLVEDVLDLARPYLVTAGVDLVLLPVHEVEPAGRVHVADVAGVQRTAGQRVLGLLGLVPVTGHHHRPAGDDLADLAGRQLPAVVADHAHHRVEDGHADGQGAGGVVDRRGRAGRHAVRRRGGLGQPVDVVDVLPELGLEGLDRAGRDRRAAGPYLGQRGQRV